MTIHVLPILLGVTVFAALFIFIGATLNTSFEMGSRGKVPKWNKLTIWISGGYLALVGLGFLIPVLIEANWSLL